VGRCVKNAFGSLSIVAPPTPFFLSSFGKKIRLVPKREHTFVLADDRAINRKVSECYIVLPQGESHTPVILGEEGDEALLGVVTLEILGLVFNPFKCTLEPMRMLLI